VAEVTFDNVGKEYADGTEAVRGLNLDIADGEFVVLVGPSGCGKTTALRMVAGLEEITGGEIAIGGEVVNDRIPRERDVAMVFQNYALYPHKTVYDNIAFPLKLRKVSKEETAKRVSWVARTLGLEEHLARRPKQLSGGQRQRVAMGRAIVREPQVFLMDEPLSNLDAKLRTQMRSEIKRLQRRLGVTTIYVTHDQVEAMTMGDRVAIMRRGELQQVATPEQIYSWPANVFVAGFVGSPPMNFIGATLEQLDSGVGIMIGDQALRLDAAELERFANATHVGRKVVVGIRPEHVKRSGGGEATGRQLRGRLLLREALGAEVIVHVEIDAEPLINDDLRELALDVDAAALDELEREGAQQKATILARLVDDTSQFASDDSVEFTIAPGALRFFSWEDGSALA
jgi:multiple sugar transport system ATP-binding protein